MRMPECVSMADRQLSGCCSPHCQFGGTAPFCPSSVERRILRGQLFLGLSVLLFLALLLLLLSCCRALAEQLNIDLLASTVLVNVYIAEQ